MLGSIQQTISLSTNDICKSIESGRLLSINTYDVKTGQVIFSLNPEAKTTPLMVNRALMAKEFALKDTFEGFKESVETITLRVKEAYRSQLVHPEHVLSALQKDLSSIQKKLTAKEIRAGIASGELLKVESYDVKTGQVMFSLSPEAKTTPYRVNRALKGYELALQDIFENFNQSRLAVILTVRADSRSKLVQPDQVLSALQVGMSSIQKKLTAKEIRARIASGELLKVDSYDAKTGQVIFSLNPGAKTTPSRVNRTLTEFKFALKGTFEEFKESAKIITLRVKEARRTQLVQPDQVLSALQVGMSSIQKKLTAKEIRARIASGELLKVDSYDVKTGQVNFSLSPEAKTTPYSVNRALRGYEFTLKDVFEDFKSSAKAITLRVKKAYRSQLAHPEQVLSALQSGIACKRDILTAKEIHAGIASGELLKVDSYDVKTGQVNFSLSPEAKTTPLSVNRALKGYEFTLNDIFEDFKKSAKTITLRVKEAHRTQLVQSDQVLSALQVGMSSIQKKLTAKEIRAGIVSGELLKVDSYDVKTGQVIFSLNPEAKTTPYRVNCTLKEVEYALKDIFEDFKKIAEIITLRIKEVHRTQLVHPEHVLSALQKGISSVKKKLTGKEIRAGIASGVLLKVDSYDVKTGHVIFSLSPEAKTTPFSVNRALRGYEFALKENFEGFKKSAEIITLRVKEARRSQLVRSEQVLSALQSGMTCERDILTANEIRAGIASGELLKVDSYDVKTGQVIFSLNPKAKTTPLTVNSTLKKNEFALKEIFEDFKKSRKIITLRVKEARRSQLVRPEQVLSALQAGMTCKREMLTAKEIRPGIISGELLKVDSYDVKTGQVKFTLSPEARTTPYHVNCALKEMEFALKDIFEEFNQSRVAVILTVRSACRSQLVHPEQVLSALQKAMSSIKLKLTAKEIRAGIASGELLKVDSYDVKTGQVIFSLSPEAKTIPLTVNRTLKIYEFALNDIFENFKLSERTITLRVQEAHRAKLVHPEQVLSALQEGMSSIQKKLTAKEIRAGIASGELLKVDSYDVKTGQVIFSLRTDAKTTPLAVSRTLKRYEFGLQDIFEGFKETTKIITLRVKEAHRAHLVKPDQILKALQVCITKKGCKSQQEAHPLPSTMDADNFVVSSPYLFKDKSKVDPYSFGIHCKYLNVPSLPRLLLPQEHDGNYSFGFNHIPLIKPSSFSSQKKFQVKLDVGLSKLSWWSSGKGYHSDDKVVFVFAGRAHEAYFPDKGVRVCLVLTPNEFESLKDSLPPHVDALVIEQLISSTYGDYASSLSLINARRIGAALLAHAVGLSSCMMLDDNIESFSSVACNSFSALYEFLKNTLDRSVCQSVSTFSPYENGFRSNIGSKAFMLDFKQIKSRLSNPEDMFQLFLPSSVSDWWGEDIMMQIMLMKLFGVNALKVADKGKVVLHRSASHRNRSKVVLKNAHCWLKPKNELIECFNVSGLSSYIRDEVNFAISKLVEGVQANISFQNMRMKAILEFNLFQLHANINGVDYPTEVIKPAMMPSTSSQYNHDFNQLITHCLPSTLYSYQKQAIQAILNSNENHQVVKMATGTGKTYVQMALADRFAKVYANAPIIIVTPTQELVKQFYEDFQNFLKDPKNTTTLRPHEIIKVSARPEDLDVKLLSYNNSFQEKRCVLIFCKDSYYNYLSNDDRLCPPLIMMDECHKYSKTIIESIQGKNEGSLIVSLSATPPKKIDCGERVFTYSRTQAVNDKIIIPFIQDSLGCDYSKQNVLSLMKALPELLSSRYHPCGSRLCDLKGMISFSTINEVEHAKDSLSNAGVKVYAIHSRSNTWVQDIQAFKESKSHCVALVVGMLGLGYSDPSLNYVVMAKSAVNADMVSQLAGRVMRGKSGIGYALTFDDANTSNFKKLRDEQALSVAHTNYLNQPSIQLSPNGFIEQTLVIDGRNAPENDRQLLFMYGNDMNSQSMSFVDKPDETNVFKRLVHYS